MWGKVRATTDLAEIVAQFISYFYRLRDENISNMEDGCRMGGMLPGSLWIRRQTAEIDVDVIEET